MNVLVVNYVFQFVEVFQMDDEQIATVILDSVPTENEESAKEAASSCPTEAIIIEG